MSERAGESRHRGPGPGVVAVAAAVAAAAAVLAAGAGRASAAVHRMAIEPGLSVVLADGERLYVEATPKPGEGLIAFARRLCDTETARGAIAEANGGARTLKTGLRYRVPFELLAPELQVRAARAIFRQDRAEAAGWRHRVGTAGPGESLWSIALWFTGRGENFGRLRAANGLRDNEVRIGSQILIPADLLRASFRAQLPSAASPPPVVIARATPPATPVAPASTSTSPVTPAPVPAPAPVIPLSEAVNAPGVMAAASQAPDALVPASTAAAPAAAAGAAPGATPATTAPAPTLAVGATRHGPLEFGRDERGEYAMYPLRAGEALYSAVVVRFTGQLYAEDVNALAREIAERSGIRKVTEIPVGFPVKIPLDVLLPEYLPPGHARRAEYEAGLVASERFKNQIQAVDLRDITVILDAGHGGADTGALVDGLWESALVYDVMVRAKRLLEAYTSARVLATTRDGPEHQVADRDDLVGSKSHAVLTTPPYPILDSKVGVNLRWYLANAIHRRTTAATRSPERVVFLSIHADSLHPSLRGAMAYIPEASMSGGVLPVKGTVYASRREVKDHPKNGLTQRELQQSEGFSRQMAQSILEAFRAEGLALHPYKPVRDRIYRGRRPWVPAVLRYNIVPAKVLLEICNLNNPEDRALARTRAFRQKAAEAIVQGLLGYYGQSARPGAGVVAARGAK